MALSNNRWNLAWCLWFRRDFSGLGQLSICAFQADGSFQPLAIGKVRPLSRVLAFPSFSSLGGSPACFFRQGLLAPHLPRSSAHQPPTSNPIQKSRVALGQEAAKEYKEPSKAALGTGGNFHRMERTTLGRNVCPGRKIIQCFSLSS